jgi:hypothetical protein
MYGGVEVYLNEFVTSTVDGEEWSASRPGHFIYGESVPGIHSIGRWAGTWARLDAAEKRKIYCHWQESNPNSSVV